MRTQWAWRTIATAILIVAAATHATQAQYASGPPAMPPMSPGYGMAAPAYGYAAAPGWGYTMPASYAAGAGAEAYGCGDDCQPYEDGAMLGGAYGDLAGYSDAGYGPAGRRHHRWLGNNPLLTGLGAIAGLLLPYSEGGCCAPHWFDVHAEAVFLERDRISRHVPFSSEGFALPGSPPNIVLSSDSFDLDVQTGLRITGTYQIGPGGNLEVTYLGLFEWNDVQVANAGNINLWSPFSDFGTNPPAFPTFVGYDDVDNAQRHSIALESKLNSVEASYRRRWMGPSCLAQGSWLIGYRYVSLVDSLRFETFAPDNPDAEGNPAFMDYNVEASNQLHGLQLGTDLWLCLLPGLNVGTELKGGIYGNSATQTTRIVSSSIQPELLEEASSTDVAFVGELNVMLNYQITRCLTVRGGYTMLGIDQVALGTENFNPASPFGPVPGADPQPRVVSLNDRGDILWYGWTLGAEYMW